MSYSVGVVFRLCMGFFLTSAGRSAPGVVFLVRSVCLGCGEGAKNPAISAGYLLRVGSLSACGGFVALWACFGASAVCSA